MAGGTQSPIVVTHEGGMRFAAQVRSHRVVVDQPAEAGGADSGPMPLELIATSLGTCVAFYVQQFLHARGLPYDGMRVTVQQTAARNPYRIGEFELHVVLPESVPAEYLELIERVARSCPAHHTLTHVAEVRVAVDVLETAAR